MTGSHGPPDPGLLPTEWQSQPARDPGSQTTCHAQWPRGPLGDTGPPADGLKQMIEARVGANWARAALQAETASFPGMMHATRARRRVR